MLSKRILGIAVIIGTIVLLCIWNTPGSIKESFPKIKTPSSDTSSQIKRYPVTDKTFLLLKTGIEVAYSRLPAHIDTTLKKFPHHSVYADSDGTINGITMIDCLALLDQKSLNNETLLAYKLRRQSKAQGWLWINDKIKVDKKESGWDLDKFKNIPAFAHAWVKDPSFDWYVMIDADSFITGSSLQELTKNKNPDDPYYLGKAVGDLPKFAHGGSGIIFSRGAMHKMFGNTQEDVDNTIALSGELARDNCCGDSVAGIVYERKTSMSVLDTLESSELGTFQGNDISTSHIHFAEWCKPVGTFHKVKPWEVAELHSWEQSFEVGKQILYADFYRKFVLPEIVEVKHNWTADYSNMDLDSTRHFNGQYGSNSMEECNSACKEEEKCTMWVYMKDSCVVIRNSVSRGRAINPFLNDWKEMYEGAAVGYMVDRIRAFRDKSGCDNLHSSSMEGWNSHLTAPGDFDVSSEKLHVRGQEES